jgi:xylan 1,4-beta-xylosidase
VESNNALVTRTTSGALVLAVWNYWPPEEKGSPRQFRLQFSGKVTPASASVITIDASHGSPQAAWRKMGSPAGPSRQQQTELRAAAAMPPAQTRSIANGALELTLPPHALALVEAK